MLQSDIIKHNLIALHKKGTRKATLAVGVAPKAAGAGASPAAVEEATVGEAKSAGGKK
jgi:hypothetical protein